MYKGRKADRPLNGRFVTPITNLSAAPLSLAGVYEEVTWRRPEASQTPAAEAPSECSTPADARLIPTRVRPSSSLGPADSLGT